MGTVNTLLIARAEKLLNFVRFYAYRFTVREGHGGVYLQGQYEDADIDTGVTETQYTRKWLLSPAMSDSEIVQTAFKLCMTSFEHQCREGFRYKDQLVFSPHYDVEALVELCVAKQNNTKRLELT